MKRFNIFIRKQSSALTRSTFHQIQTEQAIANHFGQLERDFENGNLSEDTVENMDNRKTLCFIAQSKLNYADVVFGGEGMNMVLRISGGPSAKIEAPFKIFTTSREIIPYKWLQMTL